MDYTNKKFTLDDGKTYLVIEQVDYDNHTYLYITNSDDDKDTKFIEVKDDSILPIDPELFESKIFSMFMDKFRE